MSPASVMVTWFTVIPCARFRILTTLSARPGSFLEMPQADDVVEQEHQPFQRLGVIAPPTVSLVARNETPAARTNPTRLRM
jgi:hypothetical protein